MSSFNLRRTKSTSDLGRPNYHCVDFNCAQCFATCPHKPHDSYAILLDSLNRSHRRILALKQQAQKLRGMVKQQQSILDFVKNDTKVSYRNIIASFVEESMKTMNEISQTFQDIDHNKDLESKQAQTLLAAIEPKTDMRDALSKLTKELLNAEECQDHDDYKNDSVQLLKPITKDLIPPSPDQSWKTELCFPKNHTKAYDYPRGWCPNNVNGDSIQEFTKTRYRRGNTSADWSTKLEKWSKTPKIIMPLQQIIEQRGTDLLETDCFYEKEPTLPIHPLQPTNMQVSPTDLLLELAVINQKISEGDFNGSFEEALSCCNLALVMGACRAVDPAAVFEPCCLSQAVLLSLMQQLATDMMYETQLKCRYLEEALINLDVSNKNTRKHLPLVVGEVRKHLSKFVRAYPHHVASRRISLIIMAASNLIK